MHVRQALLRRRMVRSFDGRPLETALVEGLLTDALHAPTAGNARGVDWLLLAGPETAIYWDHVTTADWRSRSARWPGLSRAPVVVLSLTSPSAYVARYGEADKRPSGLGPAAGGGGGAEAWPVPYWFGDAAFASMALLLRAGEEGLGACFLGNFRGEGPLLAALGVPGGWRLFGAVVLGHPDGLDHLSGSLVRPRSDPGARVHHGAW